MKLTDLNLRWVGAGGTGISHADGSPVEERHGVCISFDCPCGGKCGSDKWNNRVFLHIQNPVDGKPYESGGAPYWERSGEDFATISLSPSIRRMSDCGWHGFVTNGEIIHCDDWKNKQ